MNYESYLLAVFSLASTPYYIAISSVKILRNTSSVNRMYYKLIYIVCTCMNVAPIWRRLSCKTTLKAVEDPAVDKGQPLPGIIMNIIIYIRLYLVYGVV